MQAHILMRALLVYLCSMFVLGAEAEVVYTPVNVVLPANGSLLIDLNHDGITDFTLQSAVGLVWCQFGDGGYWKLTAQPTAGGTSIIGTNGYASALQSGVAVGRSQTFEGNVELLSYLGWGRCGSLRLGQWLNSPNRYLGVAFEVDTAGVPQTHYGWIKLSDAAYIDQHGNLQAVTIVSGFAYETMPGRNIVTGQTSGTASL